MPIVKWPVPIIIDKLADYRPIIGAPLIFSNIGIEKWKANFVMVLHAI